MASETSAKRRQHLQIVVKPRNNLRIPFGDVEGAVCSDNHLRLVNALAVAASLY